MRMIGIGLMGFLLAGVSLLLSTMNILEQGQRHVRELTTGPQLVFEHPLPSTVQDTNKATIQRAHTDQPVILSGFPAYQSVAFHMPIDARPTSGYLQIDVTSQVLDGVEGVLRISIHNTRRGEMLLRSGEAGRSLQIPLSPTDFAGDRLVVSLSLKGTGPQTRCRAEDGVQAVVEIETTSAVYLTLDRPIETARDRVLAWGNVARIAWPHWLEEDQQLRRMVLGAEYHRSGIPAFFDASSKASGLTTDELRSALPELTAATSQSLPDPSLTQIGAGAGLRRFHRQALWRARYDLGGHARHFAPSQLELKMLLGQLAGDQRWNLTVALNNRLVFQRHVSGNQANFNALIDLPNDVHAGANTLEITAGTTAPQNGICDQGPELVAELLPSARLIPGDVPFTSPISAVQDALRGRTTINIDMLGPLSAMEADTAIRLLKAVLPLDIEIRPTTATSQITVITSEHELPAVTGNRPTWLVSRDRSGQGVTVVEVTADQPLRQHGLSLLITPQGREKPRADG